MCRFVKTETKNDDYDDEYENKEVRADMKSENGRASASKSSQSNNNKGGGNQAQSDNLLGGLGL